jgi:hypothetical protein
MKYMIQIENKYISIIHHDGTFETSIIPKLYKTWITAHKQKWKILTKNLLISESSLVIIEIGD